MRGALFILAIVLSGCAGYVPSNLVPPAPRCMKSLPEVAPLRAGENLVERYASLRKDYSVAASRWRCLQRYAKAVAK